MANSRREKGQAALVLVLALGLVLVAGLGLVVDGAHLHSELQLAQSAADAAATAATMSMFQGTNTSGGATYFATSGSFNCTTSDAKLPCQYARMNGFGSAAKDTVTVDFPVCSGCGYDSALSAVDSPNQVRVTIQRNVSNSIIQMLGAALNTPIKTSATAAIITVQSPAPMIITHPTAKNVLSAGGSSSITICGGPTRSIQVNSNNSQAFTGGSIDLSHAGPSDPGNCATGTGADIGVFGGQSTLPGSVSLGTTGKYIQPASPILDPYANVVPPTEPAGLGKTTNIVKGVDGCANAGGCVEAWPGKWGNCAGCTSFNFTHINPIIFKPGVYYIEGGGMTFKQVSGGNADGVSALCTGCPSDANTGNGTLFYLTGTSGSPTATGNISFATQVNVLFTGPTLTTTNASGQTVPAAPYYGIAFWVDRAADKQSHQLGGGNGCFGVNGTIYATNTLATMLADATHYQDMSMTGTPCAGTISRGNIVVGELHLGGNAGFTMNLLPYGFMNIRQVALVAGGPHP